MIESLKDNQCEIELTGSTKTNNLLGHPENTEICPTLVAFKVEKKDISTESNTKTTFVDPYTDNKKMNITNMATKPQILHKQSTLVGSKIDSKKSELLLKEKEKNKYDLIEKMNAELEMQLSSCIRKNEQLMKENNDLHLMLETRPSTKSIEFELMSLKK